MGIRKFEYWGCQCDRCGCRLNDGAIDAWSEKRDVVEFIADESNWLNIDGKWYCPDCYEVDDNTDEYVPIKTP